MAKTKYPAIGKEHLASATAKDLFISTKHCIELCRCLRYKTTTEAKKILEGVITIKKPIPFRRFRKDLGHKPGMAGGRFPEKAARQFLKLVNSVEANAQFKGLNTSNLKIIKILANRASLPFTGRRQRTSTKRSHLEIEVKETKGKKDKKAQASQKEEKSLNNPASEKKKTEEIKKND